jgi:asparagine synthase (glutamine-hydrolysing)
MAHGLELRVPLIDIEMVRHVLPISGLTKVSGYNGKKLLEEAMRDLLPAEIINRPKRGFALPFQEWLAEDLAPLMQEMFFESAPMGPWESKAYRRLCDDFALGKVKWPRILSIMVLESWLRLNRVVA